MAFDKCWNVEKYKSEYESEEHWELRKKFMVTHKEKFSEDKLVCLARVFFNVEFLGCRYPEKTMQLVAELSKGVADEHREKQKGKLKRTFVQASDAAGARIKGAPPLIEPQNKMLKTAIKESSSATSSVYSCFVHEELVKPQTSKVSGPYSDFIIFISCNFMNQKQTCPIVILEQSAAKSSKYKNIKFEFPPEKNKGYERYCEVLINDKVLASSKGRSNKEAKENAAAGGLYILRKTCYTIETKYRILSQTPAIQKDSSEPQTTEALPQDNIGTKMLQKMGWSGSGLGKNQQGIKAPIKPTCQIMQRAGLGFDDNNDLRKKFKTFFYGYKASDTDADVVFASDFSKSERKTLHWLATGMALKSQSYGKGNERFLVVHKPVVLPDILERLLNSGGETAKYLLIPPTGADDASSGRKN